MTFDGDDRLRDESREAAEPPQEEADIFLRLPKTELHAHLNGCIRIQTLRELAGERGVDLNDHHFGAPTIWATPSALDDYHLQMYSVLPRSLHDCFDIFAEIPACVSDIPALQRITREALEDFAAHHVVYLELRSTPKPILRQHGQNDLLGKEEYVRTVLEVIQQFEQEERLRYAAQVNSRKSPTDEHPRLRMTCRFIISIDRSKSIQEATENAKIAMNLYQKPDSLVVGVDLGGNPTQNDFRNFRHIFQDCRDCGLKVTLHCAEVECSEGPRYDEVKAMLDFAPNRLGHALLLPPDLRDILAMKKIPVETCPTSNVMTLELAKRADGDLVHGLRQHPSLRGWLEEDYPLAVCTDDPGVFETSCSKELLLLSRAWGVSLEQMTTLVRSSLDYTFGDRETVDAVKRSIDEYTKLVVSSESVPEGGV